jgi:hypothetical protein
MQSAMDRSEVVQEMTDWLEDRPRNQPACVCPVIANFLLAWKNAARDNGKSVAMEELVDLSIGTIGNDELENRRAFMCMDWMIRQVIPTWLDVAMEQQYRTAAIALRASPKIESFEALKKIAPILEMIDGEAFATWPGGSGANLHGICTQSVYDTLQAIKTCHHDYIFEDVFHGGAVAGYSAQFTGELLQTSARNLVRKMCALK